MPAITQQYSWPSSADVTVDNIGNPIGQPAPSDAVYIAGVNPEGLLTGVAVTDGGAVEVTPVAGSLTNVNLTQVGGAAISEGQKTSANSLPVVIASDQSTLPISAASLPLPAGAATAANQATEISSLSAIVTNTTDLANTTDAIGGGVPSDAIFVGFRNPSGNLEPGLVDASGYLEVNVETSALPTGAATAANQATEISELTSIAASNTQLTEGQVQNGASISTYGQMIAGFDGSASRFIAVTSGGELETTVTSAVLPTGAATSANQTNGSQVSQVTPVKGTLTDNSGSTSATPSTSTQIMAANANRQYLLIENLSATDNIYINFTSAASAGSGSYVLLPGGSIVQETGFISTEAVNVLSTVASVPYTAKQA